MRVCWHLWQAERGMVGGDGNTTSELELQVLQVVHRPSASKQQQAAGPRQTSQLERRGRMGSVGLTLGGGTPSQKDIGSGAPFLPAFEFSTIEAGQCAAFWMDMHTSS